MPFPTTSDIAAIAEMTDPAQRNFQITRCYYELSASMARRTGLCANWCTFATWASRQAGETIRGKDLQNKLQQVIGDDLVMQLLATCVAVAKEMGVSIRVGELQDSLAGKFIARTLAGSADAVGRGNKKVFEEIGYEFSRFIATCLDDEIYNEQKIEKFCSELREGSPPGGQTYLRKAFRRYYQSFFEGDVKRAAELRYLANIEIGLHEQTRLQPEILEALSAGEVGPAELLESISWMLTERAGFWRRILFSVQALITPNGLLKKKAEQLAFALSTRMRQVLTEHMMTLTIPENRCLQLGTDLGLIHCETLSNFENKELIDLLKQIDPTPGSLNETGATDWSNLNERLHYIADLFRCCHEDKLLFEPLYR